MKKDWAIWLGCFFLFLAGIVWGKVQYGGEFFVVDNIHDLFEMLGAAATVVAVGFAAVGLNTWKSQIGAAADHELARKVAVSLVRYKEAALDTWGFADLAVSMAKKAHEAPTSEELEGLKLVCSLMREKLELAKAARSDLKGLVIECRALWGSEFENGIDQVFVFEGICSGCLHHFLRCTMKGLSESIGTIYGAGVRTFEGMLEGEGLHSRDAASDYFDLQALELERCLERKLLRAPI